VQAAFTSDARVSAIDAPGRLGYAKTLCYNSMLLLFVRVFGVVFYGVATKDWLSRSGKSWMIEGYYCCHSCFYYPLSDFFKCSQWLLWALQLKEESVKSHYPF
jgi:hypothetical protein